MIQLRIMLIRLNLSLSTDLKKKSLAGFKIIFVKLKEDLIIKFIDKLKGISEVLINLEVYTNRNPYKPTNFENMEYIYAGI